MSPAHVLEPTYARLKRGIMEGVWPQGAKLEAMRLADDFGVSMTPVRDCLNRLVGERLVELQPGEGYRVARASEQDLREMIELTAVLLDHALALPSSGAPSLDFSGSGRSYADRVANLFGKLAARSGNAALLETITAFGERLHVLRMAEPRLWQDARDELAALEQLVREDGGEARVAVADFLSRRKDDVAGLTRLAG